MIEFEKEKIRASMPKLLEEMKKKKPVEELPFCKTAPSAEHARAQNEDEPCDDSRGQQVSRDGKD